jgi:hypothetical protein
MGCDHQPFINREHEVPTSNYREVSTYIIAASGHWCVHMTSKAGKANRFSTIMCRRRQSAAELPQAEDLGLQIG